MAIDAEIEAAYIVAFLVSHPERIAVIVNLYRDQVRANSSGKPRPVGSAIAGMGIAILAGLILPACSSAPPLT
jgi:hypothetical protein